MEQIVRHAVYAALALMVELAPVPALGQDVALGSAITISPTHVLTAAHVVEQCQKIQLYPLLDDQLTIGGEEREPLPVRLIAADRNNDLALLRVANHEFDTWLKLARRPVDIYQKVFAYGFPVGTEYDVGSFSSGEVLAMLGLAGKTELFQLSAPVDRGASGGAITDVHGHLVGVIHARVGNSAMMKSLGNISKDLTFAIKTSTVATFLEAHGITPQYAESGPALTKQEFAIQMKYVIKPLRCVLADRR